MALSSRWKKFFHERSISLELWKNLDFDNNAAILKLPLVLGDSDYVGFTIHREYFGLLFASYYAKHLEKNNRFKLYLVDADRNYHKVRKGKRLNAETFPIKD